MQNFIEDASLLIDTSFPTDIDDLGKVACLDNTIREVQIQAPRMNSGAAEFMIQDNHWTKQVC
jgi:hypothetical protein